ncbi:MAG: hypothetical protein VB024_00200 [Dysgonamonadaceae bacterium]|nr:hypothetical protein [Dysgonamonadaceae bacterium]
MKLSDYKETYEYFSGKVSDIARSLSFMGFGFVWLLIGGLDGFTKEKIPALLMWVLGLLVVYLILDLIHYIYQTIVWYCHFKKLEKDHGPNTTKNDLLGPESYNICGWHIFGFKIFTLITAYVVLLKYIFELLF